MEPPSLGSPMDSMQVISHHGQTCWIPTVCEALHLVGHKVWGPGPNLEGASIRTQRGSEITMKADFVFKEYEIEMGWEHLHRKNCNKRPHEWHKMSASNEDLRPWQTGFIGTSLRSTGSAFHSEKDSETARGSERNSVVFDQKCLQRVPGGAHFHACFRRIDHIQL